MIMPLFDYWMDYYKKIIVSPYLASCHTQKIAFKIYLKTSLYNTNITIRYANVLITIKEISKF